MGLEPIDQVEAFEGALFALGIQFCLLMVVIYLIWIQADNVA